MDNRSAPQQAIIDMYTSTLPLRATLVLSTGFGKSKVTLEVIKKLAPEHIYIVVNSTDLRDKSWKEEFVKWGEKSNWDNLVTIVTYQKLARTKMVTLPKGSLVIFDEVDFIADTDILSNVIHLFPDHRILGLTGFITDSKQEWFKENLPVITKLTAEDAQDKGFLNKLHFIFVKYDLSTNESDITVTYKKYGEMKSFTQSENSAYDYQQKQFITLVSQKASLELKYAKGEVDYTEYEKAMKSYDYKITYAIKNRTELLLKAKATATIAKRLLLHISKASVESKTIVFSKRTAQSALVCGEDRVYNGTVSKKQAEHRFNQFNSGDIKVLGTCDKINRGVNITNLDTAVFETFFGSDTKAIQRFGRMMRLDPDAIATVYILLPYYGREDKNKMIITERTQQVVWAESMLRSTDVQSSSVWDYRINKTNN